MRNYTLTILPTLVLLNWGTTTLAAPSAPSPYEFEDADSWMPLPHQIGSYYALTNGVGRNPHLHPHHSRHTVDGSVGAQDASPNDTTSPGPAASPSSNPSGGQKLYTNTAMVKNGNGNSSGTTAEKRSQGNVLVVQIQPAEPDVTMAYETDEEGEEGPWWRKDGEGLWWRRDANTGVLKPVGAHLSAHGVHVESDHLEDASKNKVVRRGRVTGRWASREYSNTNAKV